jgi:hypothetical protein
MNKNLMLALGGLVGSLALASCDLNVPDLNNPGLDQLQNAPTAAGINTAATGLLIGDRGGKSATTGLVNQCGILGRESYDFDSADNRFVSELIQGNLSKASPFGGAFWGGNYANIRLANIVLHGVDKVAEFSEENKQGIRGFAHTLIALELITVIITHDDTGAVIDVDKELGAPLGPFVKKDAVYAEIKRLLDLAKTELMGAGTAFTFTLSPGYAGFNTPANFLKFNRAIKAKIDAYTKDYASALTSLNESFINDGAMLSLTNGVFHVYSLAAGDQTNGLINPAISAHPSLLTDVVKDGMNVPIDARYLAKVTTLKAPVAAGSDTSLKTTIGFKIYTNVAPVPVIRNEELILLKAEALWFQGMKTEALAELNIVRTTSGKLPAITVAPTTNDEFIDLLLYERRYSLLFEGGHRWIDLRRFGRPIPLDATTHVRNVRFPVPQAECDARPGEAACTINSSDPVN